MSTTYRTRQGDTFVDISRRVYGTAKNESRLRSANPGLSEPFLSGVTVITPRDRANRSLRNVEGLSITLGSERFNNFTSATITRELDSIDQLYIVAPFDPEDQEQRERFAPFSYSPVTTLLDGDSIFAGTLIDVLPSSEPEGNIVSLSAYSKPGVLTECSTKPREFKNSDLFTIASELLRPFGVQAQINDTADSTVKFDKVAYDGGLIWDFLVGLSKQRGLLMSSTSTGGVLFFKPPTQGPVVANFSAGAPPVIKVTPSYNARGFFSDIIGRVPAAKNTAGRIHTERTDLSVYRPAFINFDDTLPDNLDSTVRAARGRMIASRASFTVTLATWYTENGELWAPGQFVTLLDSKSMVYETRDLMVKAVQLKLDGEQRTAILNLVDAGVYE